MVTVVYKVLIKEGKEEQFKEIALKCEECAHSSKDCIYYTFYRSLNNPRDFIVSYRFTSKEAQDNHIEKLQEVIGPAPNKRDLPSKFLELVESEDVVLFDVKL